MGDRPTAQTIMPAERGCMEAPRLHPICRASNETLRGGQRGTRNRATSYGCGLSYWWVRSDIMMVVRSKEPNSLQKPHKSIVRKPSHSTKTREEEYNSVQNVNRMNKSQTARS